ncbi:MAG: helix-turn-helix domain-containing protein [Fusicatenibacter sp.]|nr:AraC family transcriptional regulator [Fusicatenibacter sp.]
MVIDFLEMMKKVVSCSNVGMTVIRSDSEEIPEFDMGVRRTLLMSGEKEGFFQWIYRTIQDGIVCYLQDYFDTEYCMIPIPEKERHYGEFILLGPYRDGYMNDIKLSELMETRGIPNDYKQELNEYYHAVPVIGNIGQWRELCITMAEILYGDETRVRAEYITRTELERGEWREADEEQLSTEMVEQRYAAEGLLLNQILNGNSEEALRCASQLRKFRLQDRYKDPLRDYRNLLISVNTLLRKTAEAACVHPVHVDRLSAKLAKRIENINDRKEADKMMDEMVRKYCLLVKNYSLRGHSPVIQKVVNHINLNLSGDLSLKKLSTEYSVNASYLSTLFKKEMGMTITDYINQQRIRRSLEMLNSTNFQIQDIASECGIYDVNYFRRLFKKTVGMTPTEYIKEIRVK